MVVEHVIDEPRGEGEEALAAQRLQGPLDAHPVLEDAIEDQVSDLVVVEGPGEHPLGGIAEGRAAVAPGAVLAAGDLQEGDGLVGDGADGARERPLAAAVFAARRARGLLGGAVRANASNLQVLDRQELRNSVTSYTKLQPLVSQQLANLVR